MLTFNDDEAGYLQWVKSNVRGFVINAEKRSDGDPAPSMLHRATCPDISRRFKNYTTSYAKLCFVDRQDLANWSQNHSSDFRRCRHCKP